MLIAWQACDDRSVSRSYKHWDIHCMQYQGVPVNDVFSYLNNMKSKPCFTGTPRTVLTVLCMMLFYELVRTVRSKTVNTVLHGGTTTDTVA